MLLPDCLSPGVQHEVLEEAHQRPTVQEAGAGRPRVRVGKVRRAGAVADVAASES